MTLPATIYAIATLVNPIAALTDASLLVDLSRMPSAWWAAVDTASGPRGRAAKDDGTELACDWIDFDAVNETGWLRVLWSGTLAASGVQRLRVYPPMAANSAYAADATFGGEAAYPSDWATAPDAGGVDRTGHGLDWSGVGTPGTAAGVVGDAFALNGSSQYFERSAAFLHGAAAATFAAWLYHATISDDDMIFASTNGNVVQSFRDEAASGGLSDTYAQAAGGPGNNFALPSSGLSPLNTWIHYALVYNAGTISVYLDGVLAGSSAGGSATLSASSASLYLGWQNNLGRHFNGRMNEVQIHTAARSAAWIEHEHLQSSNQAAMWGAWDSVAPASGRRRAMVIS